MRSSKTVHLSTVGLEVWPNGGILLIGIFVPGSGDGDVGRCCAVIYSSFTAVAEPLW